MWNQSAGWGDEGRVTGRDSIIGGSVGGGSAFAGRTLGGGGIGMAEGRVVGSGERAQPLLHIDKIRKILAERMILSSIGEGEMGRERSVFCVSGSVKKEDRGQ